MRRAVAVMVLVTALLGSLGVATAKAPITEPEAVAFARAINLRATDLPGWRAVPPLEPMVGEYTHDRRCNQIVAVLAIEQSPIFQRVAPPGVVPLGPGLETTASTVDVMSTSSLAAREVEAFKTPLRRYCFARSLELRHQRIWGQYSRLGFNRARWQSLRLPRAADGFTIHLTGTDTFAGSSNRESVRVDALGFTVGPADIYLVAQGEPGPVPSKLEHRLLSVLYHRALAHELG